jgi:hypothetical protein
MEETLRSRQQQQFHRGDDRERTTRIRQAAEALFITKPPVSTPSVPDNPPTNQSARKPRMLRIISPSPVHHDEPESPIAPAPLAPEVPHSQFARIRTLARYDMTVAQVADVYGVPVSQIERILHHT